MVYRSEEADDQFSPGDVRLPLLSEIEADLPPAWKRVERALWRIALDDVILARADGDDLPLALAGGAWLWIALQEERTLEELMINVGSGSQGELEQLLAALVGMGLVERVDR